MGKLQFFQQHTSTNNYYKKTLENVVYQIKVASIWVLIWLFIPTERHFTVCGKSERRVSDRLLSETVASLIYAVICTIWFFSAVKCWIPKTTSNSKRTGWVLPRRGSHDSAHSSAPQRDCLLKKCRCHCPPPGGGCLWERNERRVSGR